MKTKRSIDDASKKQEGDRHDRGISIDTSRVHYYHEPQ